ncbi:hypothetical protein BDFB_006808 [Asbolus verrucosus]|uniref:Uncharacterized protein n=1 Tax=Asbolus verrucosus TaxID=1661398 RepID=A0A482VJR4_ASBVE|nr:hypothetical protein BDFB_006808 [Asbolus verrucosus]
MRVKVAVLLACTCAILTTKRVTCAAIKAPLDIISLDDLSQGDRAFLDYIDSSSRSKRSGEDAIHSLKASIGQGIKSKLGLIAKGSASAVSHLSSGSSGGGHSYHHHYPETYDHKSFDFWSLKKSILNTLLQAVKAIKGGVIAIKGQLIKGSGYLISAKGKLISAKGEAITDLGKKIATSAVLSHPHQGYSGAHSDYHHYHHSGPGGYGSPSAPGPEYDVPEHFHHHPHSHEDKPDADHSGILILKKIPSHSERGHSSHQPAEHKVPDFKPIKHSGPGLGEPGYFDDDHDHDHDHDHSSHSSHEDYHHSSHESDHDSSHEYLPPSTHSDAGDHPKPSSYGSPFEEAPSFLNLHEYASESKTALSQAAKPTPQQPEPIKKPEEVKEQSTIKYDEIRPLPTAFSNTGFDSSAFLNVYNKPDLFVGTLSDKPNVAFPPYESVTVTAIPLLKSPSQNIASSAQYGGFDNFGGGNNVKYLAPPAVGPQVFPTGDAFSSFNYPANPPVLKQHSGFLDSIPSSARKVPLKRPPRKTTRKHKKPPTYDVIRSVAFQLGPNGPKRL